MNKRKLPECFPQTHTTWKLIWRGFRDMCIRLNLCEWFLVWVCRKVLIVTNYMTHSRSWKPPQAHRIKKVSFCYDDRNSLSYNSWVLGRLLRKGGSNKPPGSINDETLLAKWMISSFLVPAAGVSFLCRRDENELTAFVRTVHKYCYSVFLFLIGQSWRQLQAGEKYSSNYW